MIPVQGKQGCDVFGASRRRRDARCRRNRDLAYAGISAGVVSLASIIVLCTGVSEDDLHWWYMQNFYSTCNASAISSCRCPVFLRDTVEATYLPLNTGRLYSAANSIARTSTAFNL